MAAEPHEPVARAWQEAAAIARSVTPFAIPDPSAEQLRAYLADFLCLQGLVPIAYRPETTDPSLQAPFCVSGSIFQALVTKVVHFPPRAGSGKDLANSRVLDYSDILSFLSNHAPLTEQVRLIFSMGNTQSSSAAASSQTQSFNKRKRPDFLYESTDPYSILLYAEGEEEDKMAVAFEEIRSKLAPLPAFVFGEVGFMLAFVVDASSLQLFVKRPQKDPEPVTVVFDLNKVDDRVTLCLTFFKLYFLLLGMTRRMTKCSGMLPLFRKHKMSHSVIELDTLGCWKSIPDFSEYQRNSGVRLKDVTKAYSLPRTNQLPSALILPVVDSDGVYTVRFSPLGLPANYHVRSEDDCKKLAKDLLTALSMLHTHGLVHRDVRLENVIYYPPTDSFVLIDLETVAKPKQPVVQRVVYGPRVNGKYETSSDLYQLGVLLQEAILPAPETQDLRRFIEVLKSHRRGITAQDMLQLPWLTQAS